MIHHPHHHGGGGGGLRSNRLVLIVFLVTLTAFSLLNWGTKSENLRLQAKLDELEKQMSATKQTTIVQQKEHDSLQQAQQAHTRQLRIALMFDGAPRTLQQTGVMTSHVVNVLQALGADGRDVVDVFINLNNNTLDAQTLTQSEPHKRAKIFNASHWETFLRYMQPVHAALHNDSSCNGWNGAISQHACCQLASTYTEQESHLWRTNFLQFAFLRQAYRVVKRYQQEHGVSYDWFVRMRPDVACFEPLPAVRSLSTRRYYLITKERQKNINTNDYLFIVPKELSDTFFEEQINQYFEKACTQGQPPSWPAEQFMFSAQQQQQSSSLVVLPYQALAFPCVKVMSPREAQCVRLYRRDQPQHWTVYDVDGSTFDAQHSFYSGCQALTKAGYFGEQNHLLDNNNNAPP